MNSIWIHCFDFGDYFKFTNLFILFLSFLKYVFALYIADLLSSHFFYFFIFPSLFLEVCCLSSYLWSGFPLHLFGLLVLDKEVYISNLDFGVFFPAPALFQFSLF